jgi:molecular chaperone GrpE
MTESPEGKMVKETENSGQVQRHQPTELVAVKGDEDSQHANSEESAEKSLEKALKESVENRDRWLRAVADLENFKKRSTQERSRLLKYKEEDLLRELLPILDNLERALAHGGQKHESDPVASGVAMVMEMFKEVLKKYEVMQIESLGKKFDPQFHEAIAQEPNNGHEPNTVSKELEKGYMYKDRMLRPAKVIVFSAGK